MTACPICSKEMHADTRSTIEVEVCSAHGLWLDHGELLRITEHERHLHGSFVWADLFRAELSPPRDEARELSCPKCQKSLRREEYEGVQIDWCAEHGVWLDNGELEAILNNLRLDPLYLRGIAIRFSDARY